jgi:hypothetical protein
MMGADCMTIIGKPIYNDGSMPFIPKEGTITPTTRTGIITDEARKVMSGNPYQIKK